MTFEEVYAEVARQRLLKVKEWPVTINIALNPNFTNVVNGVRIFADNVDQSDPTSVMSSASAPFSYKGVEVVELIVRKKDKSKPILCLCKLPFSQTLVNGVENPCFFVEMASDEMTETARARREIREVFEKHYGLNEKELDESNPSNSEPKSA